MAVIKKNMMFAKKCGNDIIIIKPYTTVGNVEGAVGTVNGKKPVNGEVSIDVITQTDIVTLFN